MLSAPAQISKCSWDFQTGRQIPLRGNSFGKVLEWYAVVKGFEQPCWTVFFLVFVKSKMRVMFGFLTSSEMNLLRRSDGPNLFKNSVLSWLSVLQLPLLWDSENFMKYGSNQDDLPSLTRLILAYLLPFQAKTVPKVSGVTN